MALREKDNFTAFIPRPRFKTFESKQFQIWFLKFLSILKLCLETDEKKNKQKKCNTASTNEMRVKLCYLNLKGIISKVCLWSFYFDKI